MATGRTMDLSDLSQLKCISCDQRYFGGYMNNKQWFHLPAAAHLLRPAARGFDIAATSMPAGRPVNEDYIGHAAQAGRSLYALADGLGGHGKGDEASKTAVEAAVRQFDKGGEPAELLAEMFQQAQDNVMRRQEEFGNANMMKTTLALLLLDGPRAWYGHIGDSRIYFFDNRRYAQRTLDHSVPQMLVSSGQIRERDIRGHEDRNRLLRVIGIEWSEPKYEIAPQPFELYCGDAILLCSDGFWELITERQMQSALKDALSANEWLRKMERIVLAAGEKKEMDNYSAIAIIAK